MRLPQKALQGILMISVVIAILAATIMGTPYAMEQVSMVLLRLEASSYIRAIAEIATFIVFFGGALGALRLMHAVSDRDHLTGLRD